MEKNYSSDKNYQQFLHIAGKSPYKGTEIILNTWIKHPEYPLLIIVCRDDFGVETNCKKIISNKNYNNLEITKKLINISSQHIKLGNNVKIKYVKDRPGHDKRYALNSGKINKKLLWKSSTDINEGLKKTFLW